MLQVGNRLLLKAYTSAQWVSQNHNRCVGVTKYCFKHSGTMLAKSQFTFIATLVMLAACYQFQLNVSS